jgi:hypothetical protein
MPLFRHSLSNPAFLPLPLSFFFFGKNQTLKAENFRNGVVTTQQ